jgi:hypothetical protein
MVMLGLYHYDQWVIDSKRITLYDKGVKAKGSVRDKLCWDSRG